MSIVQLQKLTFFGHVSDKTRVLEDLQEMGCLHLESLRGPTSAAPGGAAVSTETRDAFRFLKDCPWHRRLEVDEEQDFDPEHARDRALEIQRQAQVFDDERDFLRERIADVRPWGDFILLSLEETGGLRLWFYLVPNLEMARVRETDLNWKIVHRDNLFSYVVVVSIAEPKSMPVARVHVGDKPLSRLEARLEEVESELDRFQAERESMTRWLRLFQQSMHRLEDTAARTHAAKHTFDDDPLFALRAWAPVERVSHLEKYAAENRIYVQLEETRPDEHPPTLLKNDPRLSVGEDLVSFYMTPAYRLWDPSLVVLFSFALFFAMIISDAGYGLVLGAILLLFNRKLGRSQAGARFRTLLRMLAATTIAWGILVGSYFGISPGGGGVLAGLRVFDMTDMQAMMKLSVFVGAAHVILANAMDAIRRLPFPSALAPAGWIVAILGGIALWLATEAAPETAAAIETGGIAGLVTGFLLVFLFAGHGHSFGGRIARGLLSLTRVTNAFGDILSYLRLFALGLASASLAIAFNGLARDAYHSVPVLGVVFAVLIIVLGHSLNFLLALVSGFVHGLRLNLIEFFNWSVPEEGFPFRAFAKKENPQSS